MLTLSEAARVLGIDPGTLRVQVHNGRLKARKVGPIWTVSEREVDRYRRDSLRLTLGGTSDRAWIGTLDEQE